MHGILAIYSSSYSIYENKEAYLEPCIISKIEPFAGIINRRKPLTNITKWSILDVSQGPECVPGIYWLDKIWLF